MKFEELISPIGIERFNREFKGKKCLVIKSEENIFKDYFSWRDLDNYLNQYKIGAWDRTPQLQVVLPDGNKWCKKKSKEYKTRDELLKLWKDGSSFILTLSEFLTQEMWEQCQEFEKHYGIDKQTFTVVIIKKLSVFLFMLTPLITFYFMLEERYGGTFTKSLQQKNTDQRMQH